MTTKKHSPIPIKNIFYILCYAWNVLPIMDDVKVAREDVKDAYNLLASVFIYGIRKLIRSGFHRSYIQKQNTLTTIRGKIDIQQSIKNLSFIHQKLVCSFDEYSANDVFNQILKYTLISLLKNSTIEKNLRKEVGKLLTFFHDVDSIPPTRANCKKLVFNRNNIIYRLLISIAVMIYEHTFVNEQDGKYIFKDFFSEKYMHKVFESFILNFYISHLDRKIYKVHAPKIKWNIDPDAQGIWEGLFDIDENVGERRTDVVIENKIKKIQLIMDAKYYHKTFIDAYMNSEDERTRTSHLNQLRGYLSDSKFQGQKVGALIYPMVTHDWTRGKLHPLKNQPIIVKTINLNDDWQNIEKDMLSFVKRVEANKMPRN